MTVYNLTALQTKQKEKHIKFINQNRSKQHYKFVIHHKIYTVLNLNDFAPILLIIQVHSINKNTKL